MITTNLEKANKPSELRRKVSSNNVQMPAVFWRNGSWNWRINSAHSELGSGFNPSEKYWSKLIISPSRGENTNLWNHHLENHTKLKQIILFPQLINHGSAKKIPWRETKLWPSSRVMVWKLPWLWEEELYNDLCQGLNSHYFHIIGDGYQPNSRGLYTHYKDSH